MTIHPMRGESAAMPNSARMSGNAGSMMSIAIAPMAIEAVTRAMNSRGPVVRASTAVPELPECLPELPVSTDASRVMPPTGTGAVAA